MVFNFNSFSNTLMSFGENLMLLILVQTRQPLLYLIYLGYSTHGPSSNFLFLLDPLHKYSCNDPWQCELSKDSWGWFPILFSTKLPPDLSHHVPSPLITYHPNFFWYLHFVHFCETTHFLSILVYMNKLHFFYPYILKTSTFIVTMTPMHLWLYFGI